MTTEDRLLSPDQSLDEFAEYRPLSSRAILCLLLACFSYLALVSFLLWFLPVVAIVAALLTLRFLKRPDVQLKGRRLALAAVVLAAIPLGWAPAETVVWRTAVMRQAREFTDAWMQLAVNGDKKRAYYWVLSQSARPQSESSFLRYFKNETYQERMEEYFLREPLRRMVGNPAVKVEWVRNKGIIRSQQKCYVSMFYRVEFGDGEVEDCVVTVVRETNKQEDWLHWEIANIAIPE